MRDLAGLDLREDEEPPRTAAALTRGDATHASAEVIQALERRLGGERALGGGSLLELATPLAQGSS